MNSMFRRLGLFAAVLALTVGTARAQDNDLATQLGKMGHDAAIGYTTPFFQGLGTSLNTAFYHSADLHDVLGFDVGVKLAFAKMTDADKMYDLTLPSSITYSGVTFLAGRDYDQVVRAATVAGANTTTDVTVKTSAGQPPLVIAARGQTILQLPGGLDLPLVGVPMPQLAVGLPFGLEVIGRFAPTMSAGTAGKFSYSGFGVRYDVDQFLPLFPIDIAVHFATQKLTFKDKAGSKDIFKASGTAYGVEVSKKLIFITLYGGFQLENSKTTLSDFVGHDPSTNTDIPIRGFEIEGKNKSRMTVGLRMLLLIVNVHAEYSIAKTPVFGLGLGISIR